ncbi:sulfatase-like hydrolase/transferase [Agriterribacter sp.]|uniref:sulfatase-like hydrolase/transferase n=1 Tax=Agriterribacter sp. TaxID=2821509 RepID=UPI002BFB4C1F|nr:sulfatase-like hydrolase/transferase [Agriterribacter sp.]HRP55433.1 sulfatase-like hydrolase/transferase [Agriterribacter sp.]
MMPAKQNIFIALIFVLALQAVKAQQPVTAKPNIIVIITDDQQYGTIGALGSREIITPNMDKLVKGGTAFTRAYIQGGLSGAICCPSRAMLLTGKNLFSLHEDGLYIAVSVLLSPYHL